MHIGQLSNKTICALSVAPFPFQGSHQLELAALVFPQLAGLTSAEARVRLLARLWGALLAADLGPGGGRQVLDLLQDQLVRAVLGKKVPQGGSAPIEAALR